jgi:hypothetical protein
MCLLHGEVVEEKSLTQRERERERERGNEKKLKKTNK